MTAEEFGHWLIGLPLYVKALWATVVLGMVVVAIVWRAR